MKTHPPEEVQTVASRIKRILIGKPKDLADSALFHKIALIPLLAWIGLGADGLSSSIYGPEEAFKALKALHKIIKRPLHF